MTAWKWKTLWFILVLSLGHGLQAAPALVLPPGLAGFSSFGVREGLSNVSATALAQDPEGFLWVGTEHGLFRLEGDRFRRFDTGDGLPSSRIEFGGLGSGVNRGLWVNTGKGLVFWNGRRFLRPSDLGLTGLDARSGVVLNQGGAILSDFPRKLRYLSLDGEPFQPITGLPWGKGLTAATWAPAQDLLVLALRTELWVREKGAWRHRELGPLVAEAIGALLIDGQGRILLRSNEILARLATLDGPLERLVTPARLSTVNTVGLGLDGQGRLWTNTAEGLVWLQEGLSGFIGEAQGLPQGGADILRVDRQGTLWIGGEGVHQLLGQGLWTGYTRHQGLPADVVWSVARTRDGRVWAGTAGGLAVGDGKGWRVLPGTRSNQILALEEDEDGNLWAGHTVSKERPKALSVCAAGGRVLRPVALPVRPLPTRVASLYAQGRTLWVGTSAGLYQAQRQGATLSQVAPVVIGPWPRETGINRVVPDQAGGLWVGGSDGVAHWNGRSWATLARASGLPDDNVLAIAALPGGACWISFLEAMALCRIHREGDKLVLDQSLQPPHPLLKQPLLSLAARPDGALWLGTSSGLLRWDGRHIERFGKDTGFPGDDCCQNALTFDPNGDPWVGVSVGLVHGAVSRLPAATGPPAALILEARRADGKSLMDSAASRQVPWKARTLTFSYSPRGSEVPDGLTYQVRLAGLEDAWRTTSLPEARYPGLAPGSYRFEVRMADWTGAVGGSQTLDFTVMAPWWLASWSWGLAALLLTGAGVGSFRWRTAVLRQRNLKLEDLVQERTRALQEANVALEEASLVDPLTGLRNRRYLEFSVTEDASRARRIYTQFNQAGKDPQVEKESMAFFLLDVDHFKQVNDTWGHAAGDAVLVQLADVLRAVTRASDTLMRWGGEEFLVVTKRIRKADAPRIAQTLLEAIRATPFRLPNDQVIQVTCSMGLIPFPLHPDHPDLGSWHLAIEMADQCLYAAKHSGRNRWVGAFIEPGSDPEPFTRMDAWDVQWAVEHGLMTVKTSEPGLRWSD